MVMVFIGIKEGWLSKETSYDKCVAKFQVSQAAVEEKESKKTGDGKSGSSGGIQRSLFGQCRNGMHVATLAMMDVTNQRRSRLLFGVGEPLRQWFHMQNKTVRSTEAARSFLVAQASSEGIAPLNLVAEVVQSVDFLDLMWLTMSLPLNTVKGLAVDHPKVFDMMCTLLTHRLAHTPCPTNESVCHQTAFA
jgi:hypothetical protein